MKYLITKQDKFILVRQYDVIVTDNDEIIDSEEDLESYFKQLPSSIIIITIGLISPIRSSSPISITNLNLYNFFNDQTVLPNILPTNLKSLTFGDDFNQIIQPNTLPTNLKSLFFGKKYSKFISVNQLPRNLKLLKIYNTEYPFLLKSDDERLSIEIPNRKWNPTDIFTINSKRYHRLDTFNNGINPVYLVACEQSHQLMICKIINYQYYNMNLYDRIWNEIESMISLKGSQNFAQLIDYYDDINIQTIYLFMEYYSKGDLRTLFVRNANQTYYFPEDTIWDYISQLFSILKTLEDKKIVHRDIKPSNIFIGNDHRLILGDFSCCKFFYGDFDDFSMTENQYFNYLDSIIGAKVGTEGYLAPEVGIKLSSIPNESPFDIYSVGSTILRLLSCHKDDINNHDKFIQDRSNIIISPERYSQKIIDFVKLLVVAKREDRQSLQIILNKDQMNQRYIYKLSMAIKENQFSNNITDLELPIYNEPITNSILPTNIKTLKLGDCFNNKIDISKSNSMEVLILGKEFNQIIQSNTLPTNLQSLTFGIEFNQIIQSNTLPTNLESLTFGHRFNQIIQPNSLPTNLKSLTFGDEFNQIIQSKTLPLLIESLVFGQKYSKFISVNELPRNLKVLKINNPEYPFLLKSDDEGLSIEIPNRKWNPTDIFTINSKRYHKLESFDNGINPVYLVGDEQSHQLMICKEIKYLEKINRMYNERDAMKSLKGYHNFAQLIDYYQDKRNHIVYFFIEYCPKGDLHKLLNSKANQTYYFREEAIWDYISQLFSMLETLEKMKIVHCDIKPSNIFIGKDDRLILGDFGSCIQLFDKNSSDDITDIDEKLSTLGSEGYLSPEAKVKLYELQNDIYSVGSTILRLLSCHKDDIDNHDKFKEDRNNIIISLERYSQKLINFVKLSLVAKKEDRQSLQIILNKDQNHERYIYKLSNTIKENQFSNHITELELEIYNEPITSSILPTNIKTLKLGESFNNKIDISKSNSLEKLVLGKSFNQIIQSNKLPTNLESLTFGDEFNQIIEPNSLPTNLQSLTFGNRFNQIIQPIYYYQNSNH